MKVANFSVASEKPSDAERWKAVLARDASADGSFYYSVATTGIYCRPSCGARRPKRRNVRFFDTCAGAEAAGFRPCKRCRPNAASNADVHAAKVEAACRLIEDAETTPSLAALARHSGMSPHHFHRVFRSITGVTPKEYAMAHRNARVREALQSSTSVTEAVHAAGFGSSSRFYEKANGALGMKPTEYRAGGTDRLISFATANSSLGLVLVGATDKGVCAIFLGEEPATLESELRERFPHARIVEGGADFRKLLAAVVAGIDAPRKAANLPLDILGTAFQLRVWAALRDIPPGETATYADIARRIGKPKAVRAVGAACGANPIAVAVPCHRVVGSGGKLTGYRWGIERKRKLLDRESK